MSLLVFGPSSQVGLALQMQAGPDAPYLFLGRDRVDLRDPDSCGDAIRKTRPGLVINLAGLHGSETDERDAQRVNAEAPGLMAIACAQVGAPLVHVSTAEVFDGSGEGPRRPTDTPAPVTVTGRTKLMGEDAIRDAGPAHIILRTSSIISEKDGGLVRRILADNPELSAVHQIGAPTPAYHVAQACQIAGQLVMADKSLSGTYHYQGQPHIGFQEFANEVRRQAGRPVALPEPPHGPAINHQLDCTWTEAALGLRRPDWQTGLSIVLKTLGFGTLHGRTP